MRGDGHGEGEREKGGMVLKGMYSSSSSEISFHFLSPDMCVCVRAQIPADWVILFWFEENNTSSYTVEE